LSVVAKLLRENQFTPSSVPGFEEKLFFEAERSRPYLERFVVLLTLAVIIATSGILADSLPGVAISISLVPPLCVVGISLSNGELGAAEGAFLLFLTNMLAILLAGGGVLAVLGLTAAAGRPMVVELEVVQSQRQQVGGRLLGREP
jgi:uncharacterized membrane protein